MPLRATWRVPGNRCALCPCTTTSPLHHSSCRVQRIIARGTNVPFLPVYCMPPSHTGRQCNRWHHVLSERVVDRPGHKRHKQGFDLPSLSCPYDPSPHHGRRPGETHARSGLTPSSPAQPSGAWRRQPQPAPFQLAPPATGGLSGEPAVNNAHLKSSSVSSLCRSLDGPFHPCPFHPFQHPFIPYAKRCPSNPTQSVKDPSETSRSNPSVSQRTRGISPMRSKIL